MDLCVSEFRGISHPRNFSYEKKLRGIHEETVFLKESLHAMSMMYRGLLI